MHVKSTWSIVGSIFSILGTLNNIIKLHSTKLPHSPKEIHSPPSLPLWLHMFHLNCSISRESCFVFPQFNLFSFPFFLLVHTAWKMQKYHDVYSIQFLWQAPTISGIWNLYSSLREHPDYGFLQVYMLWSGRLSEKKLGYLSCLL